MSIWNHVRRGLALLAVAATILAPARAALAQSATEPAVVVSITNSDKLMADINYLLTAAGVPHYGAFINMAGGTFIQELDGKLPSGVMVTFQGKEPKPIGFLPVKNLGGLLAKVQEQVGKAEDAGNGIKKIGLDRPMYVKQQGPYVFLADSTAALGKLPSDPTSLLANMHKTYDLAVRVNVRGIPEDMRQMAVSEMRNSFERQMEEQAANLSDGDREVQEKMGRNAIKSLVQLIEEADKVMLGWSVDNESKSTFVDIAMTGTAGSQLATQFSNLKTSQTSFGGFLMPGSAVNMNFNGKMDEKAIGDLIVQIDALHAQMKTKIDDDESLPNDEARKLAKGIMDRLMGVARKTIQGGVMDGGMTLLMDESKLQFVAGGKVANASELENAVRDVLQIAKGQPNVPEVKFNAGKLGDVTLHTMSIPIPEGEEARKVLGESLEVTLGVSPSSAYLALGVDNQQLLKKIIDSVGSPTASPPMQFNVSLKPMLKFAAAVENNPAIKAMVEALEAAGDKDHIRLHAKSIDQGIMYRLTVEEGVLQAAGRAVAAASGAGGDGDDGF